jgi:hypothetical protein
VVSWHPQRTGSGERDASLRKKAVLDRIKHLEESLTRAHEYLATGKHAHWHGFRALFRTRLRAGEELPPHQDWVRNVFVPNTERALKQAERVLSDME